MKPYRKTLWVDGETPITAAELNKIEAGIYNISTSALSPSDLSNDGESILVTSEEGKILFKLNPEYLIPKDESIEIKVEEGKTTFRLGEPIIEKISSLNERLMTSQEEIQRLSEVSERINDSISIIKEEFLLPLTERLNSLEELVKKLVGDGEQEEEPTTPTPTPPVIDPEKPEEDLGGDDNGGDEPEEEEPTTPDPIPGDDLEDPEEGNNNGDEPENNNPENIEPDYGDGEQ